MGFPKTGGFSYTPQFERQRLDEDSGWPGYRVWRSVIDESSKRLTRILADLPKRPIHGRMAILSTYVRVHRLDLFSAK